MKLSEIRGEKALDVISDLIEPVSEIFADQEFASLIREISQRFLRSNVRSKSTKRPC